MTNHSTASNRISLASANLSTISATVVSHGRGWQVIVVTILCSCIAQTIKIVAKFIRTGQLDLRLLSKTGGMPSSHSCCTAGMAVSVGFIDGFNSVSFAIAFCLAMIVMYDAAGIRRSVGQQARILNEMLSELLSNHPKLSSSGRSLILHQEDSELCK